MFSGLTHWIEQRPALHRVALRLWRLFPSRLAGLLKRFMARNWIVGAVGVLMDTNRSPPEVLLIEHSYRRRGAWGLPGGSLESMPQRPRGAADAGLPDDVLERTMEREILEELGIDVTGIRLLRVDAMPFVEEEPGANRLDFYFVCKPAMGFDALRRQIDSGAFVARSPEVTSARLVPLTELERYDLYSPHARLLQVDLPRLSPGLGM
ncbi:NUDIX hydrolase [Thiocapsa sp.]|uniref:NUDIX hydrolase n=1 Tax=Thiocapsa sp. TaxID=2024551 RepID=UPI0025DA7E84|nr:NUDIX hydrolase [Thiocapsa sp.]